MPVLLFSPRWCCRMQTAVVLQATHILYHSSASPLIRCFQNQAMHHLLFSSAQIQQSLFCPAPTAALQLLLRDLSGCFLNHSIQAHLFSAGLLFSEGLPWPG